MSHTTGRHRAPGRYNPVSEISQIVNQAGTPLAKGSAVLAASGGLVAAIAVPAQAATADDADTAPAKQTVSTSQAAAPATTAVTAPVAATSSTKASSSFGKVEVEPVAKPTGPTPYQLRMREERAAERAAAVQDWEERKEARRERVAAAQEREERQAEQEQAQQEQSEQSQQAPVAQEQESAPERTESAPSRTQERQAPSAGSNASTPAATPKSSPALSSSSSSDVISIAKQYIGTPYVFGGSSPAGFDCSGFTQYVFAKAGKSLPRVTTAQQAAATPVSSPQPGDLVFFGSPSYHVGIYVGNGQMIDAPSSGKTISIRPVFDGVSGYGRV